jgi:hypothetical protein
MGRSVGRGRAAPAAGIAGGDGGWQGGAVIAPWAREAPFGQQA